MQAEMERWSRYLVDFTPNFLFLRIPPMASAVVPAPTALVYLNGKGVPLLDKVSIHRENGAIAGYGRVQQIELGTEV